MLYIPKSTPTRIDTHNGDHNYPNNGKLSNFFDDKITKQISVSDRLLIQKRDLSDPDLTYEQILETGIVRIGCLCYDFVNKKMCLRDIKTSQQYYPLIGDLILRYYRDGSDYLLKFLMDYKFEYFPTMKNDYGTDYRIDNYKLIFRQLYCSICNIEDTPTVYVDTEHYNYDPKHYHIIDNLWSYDDFGSLKYHNVSKFWNIEKSVKLLTFLLKNNIFEYFFEDIRRGKNWRECRDPTNIYTMITELVNKDPKNLDIIYKEFEINDIRFTIEQLINFLSHKKLEIFKKFNKYSSTDTIYELVKHNDITFSVISKLFDYYYDEYDWITEALDELFITSCKNKNTNFARAMSMRKFIDRKYRIYLTPEYSINTYKISTE